MTAVAAIRAQVPNQLAARCMMPPAAEPSGYSRRRTSGTALSSSLVVGGHVVLQEHAEAVRELVVRAAERREVFAVDVDRTVGRLARAWQADPDIGSFGLTGAIDDAAHDSKGQCLDALVLRFPFRHPRADVLLRTFGQLLESSTRGASTTRTC